jgi:predicted enzyme related to lactoylglutathione lyase
MPNPIIHWEIQSKDHKKTQEFYQNLFDWHIDDNNPYEYGVVDTHAEGGITGGIANSQDGGNRITFYAQVDDLQAYVDKAERLGGKTVIPPTRLTDEVSLAMFTDPEGNVVGLFNGGCHDHQGHHHEGM